VSVPFADATALLPKFGPSKTTSTALAEQTGLGRDGMSGNTVTQASIALGGVVSATFVAGLGYFIFRWRRAAAAKARTREAPPVDDLREWIRRQSSWDTLEDDVDREKWMMKKSGRRYTAVDVTREMGLGPQELAIPEPIYELPGSLDGRFELEGSRVSVFMKRQTRKD
jgi:hypothetical protein